MATLTPYNQTVVIMVEMQAANGVALGGRSIKFSLVRRNWLVRDLRFVLLDIWAGQRGLVWRAYRVGWLNLD